MKRWYSLNQVSKGIAWPAIRQGCNERGATLTEDRPDGIMAANLDQSTCVQYPQGPDRQAREARGGATHSLIRLYRLTATTVSHSGYFPPFTG